MAPPILGIDSDDTQSQTTSEINESVESTQQSEETQNPAGKTLTDEEYTALAEKARIFDMIDADPELVAHISTHVRRKTIGAPGPAPTTQTPARQEATQNVDPTVNELRSQVAALSSAVRQMVAQNQVNEFATRNPDFNNLRDKVGELMRKHPTLSIDEAYQFVQRATATQTNQVSRTTPALSETSTGRGEPVDKSALADILDQKATPSFDDAFDKALALAMKGKR